MKSSYSPPPHCDTCHCGKRCEKCAESEERIAELTKVLEAWQKTFCHVECFEYIAKACEEEFPEFVDELRYCKKLTEEVL